MAEGTADGKLLAKSDVMTYGDDGTEDQASQVANDDSVSVSSNDTVEPDCDGENNIQFALI
eukprot:scaffold5861_cov131-Cylindrotheca_fusiformis.AAC.1